MKAAHYTTTANCDRATGFLAQDVKIMTNVISSSDAYIIWSGECHQNGNAQINGKHASRDEQSNGLADEISVPETFAVTAPVKQAIANCFIGQHVESISLSLSSVSSVLKRLSNMPHVPQDRKGPEPMSENEELT